MPTLINKIGLTGPVTPTEGYVPVWGAGNQELEDGYEVVTSIGTPPDDDTLLTEKGTSDAFDLGIV